MDRTVDFAAVGRVAKQVELKAVRLAKISGSCMPEVSGSLVPDIDLDCKVGNHAGGSLQVLCEYKFIAHANSEKAIESVITYLLEYDIAENANPAAEDLAEFARANGALHSWPFVREVLYGLTSRMGYPPYTLPLMHFNTHKAQAPSEPAVSTE